MSHSANDVSACATQLLLADWMALVTNESRCEPCDTVSFRVTMNRRLSIREKKNVLDMLNQPGATQSSVAKAFGISRKTVYNVTSNRTVIEDFLKTDASQERCHLKTNERFHAVNEATLAWFTAMREKHGEFPIVESIVCKKAMEIAQKLHNPNFKASKGWFRSWSERCGIQSYKICGESLTVPGDAVDNFRTGLPDLLQGYADSDIFNCDETALYYKRLPERTLHHKGTSVSGGKKSKERVTLLLCGSMTGEKLSPLVIGKSQNPRCLRGVERNSLPCSYSFSKNAWMTSALFQSWLSDVNRKMVSQNRSILLFMDNAPCHNKLVTYPNVKLVWLPPNCSAVLQPMDQGVIWSFKCLFRKYLLEFILPLLENELSNTKAEVDILMAMHLVKKAWMTVHPDVLINAFIKAGFKPTVNMPVIQPPEDKCDLIEDFNHYVSIDDRLFEEEIACLDFNDEEYLDELVTNQSKRRKEEEESETMDAPKVISIREAQKLLDQFKLFALANARVSGRLLECTIDLNSAFFDFQRRAKLRQTTIHDFCCK